MGALDKIASSTSRTPATNKRKQKNSALPYTPTITALPEINITNVQKAVKALIAYTLKKEKEEETIQVTIAVKKVSGRKVVGAKRIVLPHPIHPKETPYALVIRDKDFERVEKMNLDKTHNVKLLLPISKIKKLYKSFDEKKKVAAEYTWLIDEPIEALQPTILGSIWKNANKAPLAVCLVNLDAATKSISLAQTSTSFMISQGSMTMFKAAALDLYNAEQAVENIMQGLPQAVNSLPKKMENILNINLRTSDSVSLPIYGSVRVADTPYVKPTKATTDEQLAEPKEDTEDTNEATAEKDAQ